MTQEPAFLEDEEELESLLTRLGEIQERITEIRGGEIDAILDPSGFPLLLKSAQRHLQESSAREAALLDALPAQVALFDQQGQVVAANPRWEHGEGLSDLPCHESERLREVLQGFTRDFESEYVDSTGGRFLVNAARIGQDSHCGSVVVKLDITARQEAENNLRISESRERRKAALLRIAGTTALVGGWTIDVDEDSMFWADEVYSILALHRNTAPTLERILELCSPASRQTLSENINRCRQKGTSFDTELEIISPSNEIRWLRCRGEAGRDEDGNVWRLQGVFQDITEIRKAEKRRQDMAARLYSTLENLDEAFYTLNALWEFTYVNKAFELMFDRGRQDILGKVLWEEFPASADLPFRTNFREAAAERQAKHFEAFSPTAGLWLEIRVFPSETGLAVYCKDVTKSHLARKALEISERRFRELAEQIQDVFYSYEFERKSLLYVSPAVFTLWGISAETVYREPSRLLDAVHPEDRERVTESLSLFDTEGLALEYRIIRPDGEIRWVLDRSFPILGEDGSVGRVVGTVKDITETTMAFTQSCISEERFRLVSKATNDVIWDWDVQSDSLWFSDNFEKRFGYRFREGDFADWADRLCLRDKERVLSDFDTFLQSDDEKWKSEYRFVRRDGTRAHVLDRAYVIRDEQGRATRVIGSMADITERKEAEIRLAEQAALLDQASDAILVFHPNRRVAFWSRGAEEIYGWQASEAIGKCLFEMLETDESAFQKAKEKLLEDNEWTGELVHRTRQGKPVDILARWSLVRDDGGEPKSVLAIHTDVTEQKALEEQLLRTQRLESVGTLAGGLAHDLNNLLAPIILSAEILTDHVTDKDGLSVLETVKTSAERGADLIKKVLGFARGFKSQRRLIRPDTLVKSLEKMLRETFPRNIQLRVEMPDEPWAVSADATQLHQVLMNLCVNARDAMPDGGKLTLTLGNFVVDDVFAGMNVDAQPGPYVVFQVEDTGHGMLPEVRERIFEPFFSTKEVGEGTGLGLSTSFSIVRGHGGFMNIYSEPRKGTRFKVYLPAEADAVVIEERAVEQTRLPRGNGELILIVDDEEDVRKITKKALERFGYRVLLASNGAEAVSVFVKNQDEVAVVLTDMSMPVMDGPALIVALKSISPGVRIIASSGLPANGNVTKAVSAGIEHFVAKPYTAKTLLNTLRTILGPDTEPTPPEKESRPEPRPQSEDQPRKPKERSGETILVVDDQESLLRLCRTLLERAGYTVRTACSAAEALSVLAQSKVDLAVVDLNMPGKGGLELVREMQEEYPEVKVLFVSGSSSEVTTRDGHTLLPKPYSPAQLTENVRTLLSSDYQTDKALEI